MHQTVFVTSLLLLSGLSAQAQETGNPTPTPEQVAAEAAKVQGEKITYGRIKDVKAGKKIVIDVENGRDKSFNLADPKTAIKVAEDLAVGDPVKILESGEKAGRSVQIVRDVRKDASQDEQTRARTADSDKQDEQSGERTADSDKSRDEK